MSLTAIINERNSKQSTEVMYSAAGAKFQEYCINRLDRKNSAAHKMIGSLVTAINNNQISVSEATSRFNAALEN